VLEDYQVFHARMVRRNVELDAQVLQLVVEETGGREQAEGERSTGGRQDERSRGRERNGKKRKTRCVLRSRCRCWKRRV